ncbi:helix-turn-helix transcriptional regulator [Streptomyces triticirhizae]|uniref:XRE family transcriptional regulator n=1 Tax=Streptomyces triticirhizae TaxID=2483353 RepID=A0A3M2MA90_9ACTN|nr:helix-turn-helix transcriptional regulator [Streptomyces triticirhizae]RMI46704.1 XRE family transcriptional regulator [Streptomyces triticirhizae]
MPQPERPLDDTVSMRAWFGVELRNWRKARGLSTQALGDKVQLSKTSVERIEKAERSCTPRLAAAFDDALQAGGALKRLWRRVEDDADRDRDADIGRLPGDRRRIGPTTPGRMAPDRPPLLESPVERRAFLTAGGMAAVSLTDLAPHLAHALPRSVRPEDIEQIRSAARDHASWDNRYGGGGLARATAVGQLHWASNLLNVACPPKLEPELFTAVGVLAATLGASAFDAYEHEHAAQLFDLSVHCAERSGNWHLRARALNWRSRQATWRGSPDWGLTYAEMGLVRADRLTPRERAMLHGARARALAKMGQREATLAAIGRADDAFALARPREDPEWMAYYDYAQHHGDTGHAAFDIALLDGQPAHLAETRLTTAIEHHTDAYVRSRSLSGTKLATLVMRRGDPQRAVTIAHRALEEIGQLRSQRAVTDVEALASASSRFARRADVAELRERIRTAVAP